MGRLRQLGIAAVVVTLSACGGGPGDGAPRQPGVSATDGSTAASPASPASPTSATARAEPGRVRVVRTIATGLDVPWGLALLPGGKKILVGSRDDRHVYRIDPVTATALVTVEPGGATRWTF